MNEQLQQFFYPTISEDMKNEELEAMQILTSGSTPFEVVGEPKDWLAKKEDGSLKLDIYGKPYIDTELWANSRWTANGHQKDGYCIGASAAGILTGVKPGHQNGCLEGCFPGVCKTQLAYDLSRREKRIGEKTEKLFRIGHVFEDIVARAGAEYVTQKIFEPYGYHCMLVNDERMFRSSAVDKDGRRLFLHSIADMDRILKIYDENNNLVATFGVECKTGREDYSNRLWNTKKWSEEGLLMREEYFIQCHQYMAIRTDLDGFFIFALGWTMNLDELITRFIPRNYALEKRILENNENFAHSVLNGLQPDIAYEDPTHWLTAMAIYDPYGLDRKRKEKVAATKEVAQMILTYLSQERQLSAVKAEAKKRSTEIEAKQNELLAQILDQIKEKTVEFPAKVDYVRTNLPKKEKGEIHNFRFCVKHKRGLDSYDLSELYKNDRGLFLSLLPKMKLSSLTRQEKADIYRYKKEGEIKPQLQLDVFDMTNFIEDKRKEKER